MLSQSNEFQVTLPSNVNGNPRNTPVQFEKKHWQNLSTFLVNRKWL